MTASGGHLISPKTTYEEKIQQCRDNVVSQSAPGMEKKGMFCFSPICEGLVHELDIKMLEK